MPLLKGVYRRGIGGELAAALVFHRGQVPVLHGLQQYERAGEPGVAGLLEGQHLDTYPGQLRAGARMAQLHA